MAKKKAGKKCDWLGMVALILLIIGGLNWLLVGAFNFDLVFWALNKVTWLMRAVYILVGVAAIYALFTIKKHK